MVVCDPGSAGTGLRGHCLPRLSRVQSPTQYLFLVIISVVIASTCKANGSSLDTDDDASSFFVSSLNTRRTTDIALIPASPDCWLEAMQVLKMRHKSIFRDDELFDSVQTDGNDSSDQIINTMTCRWMTSDDQKVLALELSKCHMEDIGRPLFQFQDENQHSSCSRVIKDYNGMKPQGHIETDIDEANIFHRGHQKQGNRLSIASNCLVHLTDTGVSTYTHFFSYVNELCTRLLSETVLGMYRQTSHQLVKSSKIAESKIQALIEQQDVFFDKWSEREEHVLNIYDELDCRIQEKSSSIESEIQSLREKIQDEHRLRNDEYKRYQDALADEIQKYREEFTIFSNMTRKARNLIQASSYGLDSVISWLKAVHVLFEGVVYNVCGILFSYILTIPFDFRWMRFYMLATFLMSLSVDMWIVWVDTCGDKGATWMFANIESRDFLRTNSFYAICNFCLLGIFVSLFFGYRRPEGQNECNDEELLERYEARTNDNIRAQRGATQGEHHDEVESSFLPERSVKPNYAFAPFLSSGSAPHLYGTYGDRARATSRLSSDPISAQQPWNQQSYFLMQYMMVPPPPIGSRACPIIIESNDETSPNVSS